MRYIIIIFILLPLVGFSQQSAYRKSMSNPAFKVMQLGTVSVPDTLEWFWFWGQSNMVGRDEVTDIPDSLSYVNTTIDSLFITDGDFPTNLPAAPYIAGVTSFGNPTDFGPELGFFDTLTKVNAGNRYYLLKTAIGSTWIEDWTGDGVHEPYFWQAKRQIDEFALGQGKVSKCVAFVTMQGENDAIDSLDAELYDDRFAALIDTVRASTNQPDLPIIVGEINGVNDPVMEFRDIVRQSQYNVCRYEIAADGTVSNTAFTRDHTYLVDTDTYTFMDVVHYDAASTIQFAWDLYRAFLQSQ